MAGGSGSVEGRLDARALPRLEGVVQPDCESPVAYTIAGDRDSHGRPALRVAVSGKLWTQCQRCLRPMPVQVVRETLLVIASTEAELDAWDADDEEVALADRAVSAQELVEDEVLLTLPIAPRHAQGECEVGSAAGAS
jgi:uncharacterized protein